MTRNNLEIEIEIPTTYLTPILLTYYNLTFKPLKIEILLPPYIPTTDLQQPTNDLMTESILELDIVLP